MANTLRAPKQWCLNKNESVNSFENWRQNIIYTLSLDANFAPHLADGVTWEKKTRAAPQRGFTDDGDNVQVQRRRTALQKIQTLELMLGQIANYCPIISRNTIIKNSTSINSIWQAIRLHFGFQSTGAHFIDFAEIHIEPDEKPEDLYQRLMAFMEDNLIRREGGITHHGEIAHEDEEFSPSLENFVVLTWLRLIHKDLPKLIKQRYGTELRSRTLATIKPEISQALDSLIEEIHATENAKVLRSTIWRPHNQPPHLPSADRQIVRKTIKSCPLCKAAGRTSANHFLSECKHLPDQDKKYMLKARQISHISDDDQLTDGVDDYDTVAGSQPDYAVQPSASTLRVQVRQSPYIDAFYRHRSVRVTIDSGATGNMIRRSTAVALDVQIKSSSQSAHQADGSSPLQVVGETRFILDRDGKEFIFEGLVLETLDVDILAGIPFMERNDIGIRPAHRQVTLDDGTVLTYGSPDDTPNKHTVSRACVLRAPTGTRTVWPGEYVALEIPQTYSSHDDIFALEPRTDIRPTQSSLSLIWPQPGLFSSVSGKIRVPNLTDVPQTLRKDEHFCQIRPVFIPVDPNSVKYPPASLKHIDGDFSSTVQVDPNDILPPEIQNKFHIVLKQYDEVFNPRISGYNGNSGPFQAVVNMGPVQPPQRKGRIPQYCRDKLLELQHKFDELEDMGVFVRPEDAGIQVEYLNPSFLIKKASGGHRLVTAFADVGRYSKPQPSLMPDVNSTLRQIGQWKYIITSDLSNAFYQIPLAKNSMKYCGVATPFRGTRVYARSAMGMPGSETALEELMCRVFGDLLEEGIIAKIADDLYCGANTPTQLLSNWTRVLQILQQNSLRLSARKTVISPTNVTILGWQWQQGSIHASQHRIATLSPCSPPSTVKGLRSFIGAYKVLARVIQGSSTLLSPLDNAVAGRQSQDKIVWSDGLQKDFLTAQKALTSHKAIVLPRPDDQIWIATDAAVRKPGIGATMYVTRNNKLRLAGFFSVKLRRQQITWLPCEVEALSIAVATQHFSPYLIQSKHKARILTDSRPCVLAFEKLCRGEFSTSPRVSTFLSTVSRYQASIQHLSGSANVPSDFTSRNAPECENPLCQVCGFIARTEDSVVRNLSVSDILAGTSRPPFTNRSAWRSLQDECKDLRRTHAHLSQGTRPSKKLTNIKDVKRYLNAVTIAKDGLLVVSRNDPLCPSRQNIVVPRQVLDGLLTSLHIQLHHPSAHQLKMVTLRYFFALDMNRSIDMVTMCCHQCASLRNVPHTVIDQSTASPPEHVGISFAADVMKRERQCILVVRECVTSYTTACIIDDERGPTIRNALIRLCIELRPLDGPPAVIRTDPAPCFMSLINDTLLQKQRMSIEIGRVKNINKNPVAEKAVQELEHELLRQEPLRGPVNATTLSMAVASLNSRIRTRGASAREMWTQRDQFTNSQLPLTDQQLILSQHSNRMTNHPHSEKSKAPIGRRTPPVQIIVGDLVYLHCDRNKTCARSRYIVIGIDGPWCDIRKFIGSQLRNTSYRVKMSECYKVASWTADVSSSRNNLDDCPTNIDTLSETDESPNTLSIPLEISTPPLDAAPTGHVDDMILENNVPQNAIEVPDSILSPVLCPNESDRPTDVTRPISRPSRSRRMPNRFKDFVTEF